MPGSFTRGSTASGAATVSEVHIPANEWGYAAVQSHTSTFFSTDLMPNWQIQRPGTGDNIRAAVYLPAGTWSFSARHYAANGEGEAVGAIILLSLVIRRAVPGDVYGNGNPPSSVFLYRSALSGYFPATRPGDYSIMDHPLASSVVSTGVHVAIDLARLTSDGTNSDTQAAGGYIRFVEMIAKKV